MAKWKWYNNGIKNIKVFEDTFIPEGFYPGKHQKEDINNKDFIWYTNGIINKKFHLNDDIPEGFYPGQSNTNHHAWNKGLTKDIDPRLICSEETRQKHSENGKGEKNHMYGKHHTIESKQKMSDAKIGKDPWNKGMKYSEDEIKQRKAKEYETKKKNGTLTSSKPEEDYYIMLCNEYGKDDVERQYAKDERYPFACDFYIKSLDKFIEINYNWGHGNKPFDTLDEECLKILNIWKSKDDGKNYYHNAIIVWTIRDVKKLETARKNHLNFEFIYPNNFIVNE